MSSTKFRRAYSLRIPRSPKTATFPDSTGLYDRLDETEAQDDFQSQNEAFGKKDNTSFSWDIPLITDAPKLHYCRKKWSSKSLRLPKSRPAVVEPPAPQPEDGTQVDDDTDSYKESERCSSSEGRRLSDDSEGNKETENEGQRQKSKKMKQYKKTIDRAFRRGWDTFISNIYTISLTRTSQDAPQLIKAC